MQAPDVEDSDTLNGQVLEVEVAALTDSIGDLKARLAEVRPPHDPAGRGGERVREGGRQRP